MVCRCLHTTCAFDMWTEWTEFGRQVFVSILSNLSIRGGPNDRSKPDQENVVTSVVKYGETAPVLGGGGSGFGGFLPRVIGKLLK